MSESSLDGGGRISAVALSPSLNLSKLAELLALSVPPIPGATLPSKPFAHLEGSKLRVNTRTVLDRLIRNEEFLKEFEPGRDGGFIRDMALPPMGMDARIGGRLLAKTELATSKNIALLQAVVRSELDAALGGFEVNDLVAKSLDSSLNAMARSISVAAPATPKAATLVPICFGAPERLAGDRIKDIARMVSSMESVDGRDWLEVLLDGIGRRLTGPASSVDLDDDEVAAILVNLRKQREDPLSQISLLLDFLEDEALSRVRMQVSMKLMQSIAGHSKSSYLKAYVSRVQACFDLFAGANGESLELDISSRYGVANNVDLATELGKATFYSCLSVWAEWSTQIYERRSTPSAQRPTVREVSYRFRINGNNPKSGLPSFDTRLGNIKACLQPNQASNREGKLPVDTGPSNWIKRNLAQLVFLNLVLPHPRAADAPIDILAEAKDIAERLRVDPDAEISRLIVRLESRKQFVNEVARHMIAVLKTRSTAVIDIANRRVEKFVVYVHKDIVNMTALMSMISSKVEVFVKSDKGPDKVAWLRHVQVSDSLVVTGSIASLTVENVLQDKSLTPSGPNRTIAMSRETTDRSLAVRFVPCKFDKHTGEAHWDLANPGMFDTGLGIDLEYSVALLGLSAKSARDPQGKARAEQLRAATLSAFTILCYLVLWDVVRRIKNPLDDEDEAPTQEHVDLLMDAVDVSALDVAVPDVAANEAMESFGQVDAPLVVPPLSMTMVRLQYEAKGKNRDEDAHDGNTAVYSISHALEKALSRELPVKLQGLAVRPGQDYVDGRFVRSGALQALMGGQPMRYTMDGSLEKLALLTYVTRPCDTHPDNHGADAHLFISRTYTATQVDPNTMEVRADRMQSRLVDIDSNEESLKTPQLILEEVARLEALGYKHIVLLSHHFGNRRIGRAAGRHAPHSSRAFLNGAGKRFPDVHLYPLRRDIFSATRLRLRGINESAFEVVSFAEHQKMYFAASADVMRSLLPVYTFATLHVVGNEERPQSGFCTYFYDLEMQLDDLSRNESVRQNILGTGAGHPVHASLVGILRAVHFLECEKPLLSRANAQQLPVLDPFDWAMPSTSSASGEIVIMERRGKGSVVLSVPAMLAQVTKVLHKEST